MKTSTTSNTLKQLIRNMVEERFNFLKEAANENLPKLGNLKLRDLTKEQEVKLITQAKSGTEENKRKAFSVLKRLFEPVIFKLATKQAEAFRGGRESILTLQDLQSAGYEALSKAIQDYDLEKAANTKFSTWAFYYIRNEIYQATNALRPMHVPHALVALKMKIDKIRDRFFAEQARFPTEEEIVDELDKYSQNSNPKIARKGWADYEKRMFKTPEEKLQRVMDAMKAEQSSSSIDRPMSPTGGEEGEREEGPTYSDFLPGDTDPSARIEQSSLVKKIKEILTSFPKREQQILHDYFTAGETIAQIAPKYDLSPARISTIIKGAKEKLSKNPAIQSARKELSENQGKADPTPEQMEIIYRAAEVAGMQRFQVDQYLREDPSGILLQFFLELGFKCSPEFQRLTKQAEAQKEKLEEQKIRSYIRKILNTL